MRVTLTILGCVFLFACEQKPQAQNPKDAKNAMSNLPAPMTADRARCERKDKKVVEFDVNRDGRADVWKVYKTTNEQGTRIEILNCKEDDLNFDDHMDMWTYYDDQGNVTLEEFDFDFDGRIDARSYYQQGHLVRKELSTSFDGKPDIWEFYEQDKLTRRERSSRRDDKIDVWEFYENGRLDRIGYDTTGSGKVDKWDRPAEAEQDTVPAPAATPAATSAPAAAPTPPASAVR